jgi:hypothetical protein
MKYKILAQIDAGKYQLGLVGNEGVHATLPVLVFLLVTATEKGAATLLPVTVHGIHDSTDESAFGDFVLIRPDGAVDIQIEPEGFASVKAYNKWRRNLAVGIEPTS